ncbi:MAG TPA: hypothetical protein PL048_23785, partial [Leptospiraceae bacterium]|nr:hypothetical protein [Leptospiraceae bacterium]
MDKTVSLFIIFLFLYCASPKVQEKEITIEDDTDLFLLDENPDQKFFWVSERKGTFLHKKAESSSQSLLHLPFRAKVYINDQPEMEHSSSWTPVNAGSQSGYVKTANITKKFPEKFHGYKIGPEEELCDNISNSFECYKTIEYIQSAKPETVKKFKRLENEAQFRLNRKRFHLKDGPPEKQYRLLKYFPEARYFLIAVQFYEGSSLMLLNERSGKIYNIPDYPVISPDGKRIISACYCPPFALGYCKNEILVFQFAGHSNELKKEFHLTPDDYGAG